MVGEAPGGENEHVLRRDKGARDVDPLNQHFALAREIRSATPKCWHTRFIKDYLPALPRLVLGSLFLRAGAES